MKFPTDIRDDPLLLHVARLISVETADLEKLQRSHPTIGEMELLGHLILSSSKSKNTLLLFGSITLHQYDDVITATSRAKQISANKQIISGVNEVIYDRSARLECAVLRKIFMLIEALVFKVVHLKLEGQSKSYRERTESYECRIERLNQQALINDKMLGVARDLYKTRCQFAHSLRDVKDLTYKSKKLRENWGSVSGIKSKNLKRQFLPDVYTYSEVLLGIFKPIQLQQIDFKVFTSELSSCLSD